MPCAPVNNFFLKLRQRKGIGVQARSRCRVRRRVGGWEVGMTLSIGAGYMLRTIFYIINILYLLHITNDYLMG